MSKKNAQIKRRALRRAVKQVGSQAEIAARLNVSRQAVNKWVANGFVPVKKVLAVERISGVSRHDLDPDYYPVD